MTDRGRNECVRGPRELYTTAQKEGVRGERGGALSSKTPTGQGLTFLSGGGQKRSRAETGGVSLSNCKGQRSSLLALPHPQCPWAPKASAEARFGDSKMGLGGPRSRPTPSTSPGSVGAGEGTLQWRSQHLRGLKQQSRASPVYHVPMGWGLRPGISSKFPGHADSAGPGTHFEDH